MKQLSYKDTFEALKTVLPKMFNGKIEMQLGTQNGGAKQIAIFFEPEKNPQFNYPKKGEAGTWSDGEIFTVFRWWHDETPVLEFDQQLHKTLNTLDPNILYKKGDRFLNYPKDLVFFSFGMKNAIVSFSTFKCAFKVFAGRVYDIWKNF